MKQTYKQKRRMLPTSGKLLVDNIAGIPDEGVVRVMPENKIYSYSGVVPTRKRRRFMTIRDLLSKSKVKLPKRGILELGPPNKKITLFVSEVVPVRKRRMKEGFVRIPQELPDFWGKGWIDYAIDIRKKFKKK